MGEITSSDALVTKLQEFDKYVTQSFELLKTLKDIKDDVQKLSVSLSEKKKEVSRYESELWALQQKIQSISNDAEKITAPLLKERTELAKMSKKLADAIAQLDGTIQVRIQEGLANLSGSQNEFQEKVREYIRTFRKETESQTTDFLYKQNALVSNLSQQIDSYQRLTESLKIGVENQSNQIRELQEQSTELRQSIEAQSKRFEKETAQLRSEISELTAKLSNMKFKRILGI